MFKTFIAPSYMWLALILALFLWTEYLIVRSIFFSKNPALISVGVGIDITLGIPALFYFFVVRPKKYSILSLLPVFFISLWIAKFMIPSGHQNFLSYEKKIIPLIEVVLIGYLATRIRAFVKLYREIKATKYFFLDSVRQATCEVFSNNKAVNILLSEFLLIYFAFAGWFKKFNNNRPEHSAFTYHHKNAYSTVLSVMIALLCIETAALHIILLHWSKTVAIIITALSIYSLFWLIGDFHLIRLHPVLITEDDVYLRIGLRWKATIPISAISHIDIGSGPPRNTKGYVRASVLGARVVLNLHQPVAVQGLFGLVKHPSMIGLSIDDADRFSDEIMKRKEPPKAGSLLK